MAGLTINIGWEYFLGVMASLIFVAWYSGSRFTRIEVIIESILLRLTAIEGKSGSSFAGASPLKLLPKGQTILIESGLREYLENDKTTLLASCGKGNGMDNPYDIQTAAFKFMDTHDFGSLESSLKTAAFDHGVSLEVVRRIAGIYFRDLCLAARGFTVDQIEEPKQ